MKFETFLSFRRTFAASGIGVLTEYLLLAATGAFCAVIFPAVNWSIFAWFTLIPLFLALRNTSGCGAFLRGLTWGWFWSFCSFFWLREIAIPLPFVLAFVLGLFPAFWAVITNFLWKNLAWDPILRLKGAEIRDQQIPFASVPLAFLFLFASTSAWCILEWIRGWIATGLPWNYLGTALWKNLPFIQICEFTGIFGVSFLIAFFNLALVLSAIQLIAGLRQKKYSRPYPLFAALLMIAGNILLGMHLFKANAPEKIKTKSEAVGMVQCDMSQRRFATEDQAKEALSVCIDLSEKMLKENEKFKNIIPTDGTPDRSLKLIIWPETAVPYAYAGGSPVAEEYRAKLGALIDRFHIPFLIGSIDFQVYPRPNGKTDYDVFNAALLINRSGGSIADRYYKIHRVPFGEYVPWGDEFPILTKLTGMGRNLAPGTRFHPIEILPGVRAGVSICYESVFPKISRGHVLNGANLLLIISNDAWYPTSSEPDQHFVNGLFRAIETRLPLLRSGNSNYSVLISPRGEILDSLPKKGTDPAVRTRAAGIFHVPVPLEHKPTFYTIHGNLFIGLCGIFLLCALIKAFVNWMIFRKAQVNAEFYRNAMKDGVR